MIQILNILDPAKCQNADDVKLVIEVKELIKNYKYSTEKQIDVVNELSHL